MSELERWSLAGPWKAEPDAEGEWVLFRDVRALFDHAVELSEELERQRSVIRRVAGVPLTLPSAALAVDEARRFLDGERERE